MSGRAKKLLNKLQQKKLIVDKNFNKNYKQLQQNKEIFDIIEDSNDKPKSSITVVEEKEIAGFSANSYSLQRVDYEFPNENYGLELIVPSGIITASGIRSGAEVEMLGGSLEGRSLEVIDVINSTTLRLDDVSTFSNKETGVPVKFILNKE